MTVDEDTECPFCQETLTYVQGIPADKEQIVYNKYYWLYKLKTMWFSLACLVFCIVRLITASQFWYPNMILFGVLCIIVSLIQRPLMLMLRGSVTEERAEVVVVTTKYVLGALSILVALFTR